MLMCSERTAGGTTKPANKAAVGKAKRKAAANKRKKTSSDSSESAEEASNSDGDTHSSGKIEGKAVLSVCGWCEAALVRIMDGN